VRLLNSRLLQHAVTRTYRRRGSSGLICLRATLALPAALPVALPAEQAINVFRPFKRFMQFWNAHTAATSAATLSAVALALAPQCSAAFFAPICSPPPLSPPLFPKTLPDASVDRPA